MNESQENKLPPNFVLCIAEKPSAGKRIAEALNNDKTLEILNYDGEKIYKVKVEGKYLLITAALGHIFSVVQDGYGSEFPTYDFKWVPLHQKSRGTQSSVTKYSSKIGKIYQMFKYLIPKAKDIIIMTDYDQEGEVIGGIILKEIGGKKAFLNAKRMTFSTLTKKELVKSFKELKPHINFNLFDAGVTRHYLDWLYGINLSRALMLAYLRETAKFKSLSTGRVQGPTLRFVYDREIDIKTHVPLPFWQIKITIEKKIGKKKKELEIRLEKNFESEKEAKEKINQLKYQEIFVKKIEKKKVSIPPPVPPNLSNLQSEIYRLYKITPEQTLSIAEKLYLSALISYPRTESQQYPEELNHLEIITKLIQIPRFNKFSKKVLPIKENRPVKGKKKDPAHPAIYPTGERPDNKLSGKELKVYDHIVKRYLSCFSEDALEERKKVVLKIGEDEINLFSNKILEKGWKDVLGYEAGKTKDGEFIDTLKEGEKIVLKKINLEEKFTTPPFRYNPSSLLKEMEKKEIGTKATRADIINTLKLRGYIKGKEKIEITDLGLTVIEILKQNSPIITLPDLTRQVERSLKKIEDASLEPNIVILQGITYLHKVLLDLHHERGNIAQALEASVITLDKEKKSFGKCPICKTGDLEIRITKNNKRFLGCTNYFDEKIKCEASFPLPQKGKIEKSDKKCPVDGFPMVKIISNRRSWYWCLNPDCPDRKNWSKKGGK